MATQQAGAAWAGAVASMGRSGQVYEREQVGVQECVMGGRGVGDSAQSHIYQLQTKHLNDALQALGETSTVAASSCSSPVTFEPLSGPFSAPPRDRRNPDEVPTLPLPNTAERNLIVGARPVSAGAPMFSEL